MKSKNAAAKIWLIFFIFLLLTFVNHAEALVGIEPASKDLSIQSNLYHNVNITISGVNEVYGFQFDVIYNQSVLEFVKISEATFLNRSKHDRTFCLDADNSTPGLIANFACSRIGSGYVSGSGVLANITFRLKTLTKFPGISYISLPKVKISNINSQPLDKSSQNGMVRVYQCLQGETRTCTVSSCQGNYTCNSSNEWGQCIVSAQPEICDGIDNDCDGLIDEGVNRSCSVNHKGICATGLEICTSGSWAGCPAPQTEICDNGVDESCDGDDPLCEGDIINSAGSAPDRCVDIFDLVFIAARFGSTSGSPDYDIRADIKRNGEIDIFDLVVVGRDFGYGSACSA